MRTLAVRNCDEYKSCHGEVGVWPCQMSLCSILTCTSHTSSTLYNITWLLKWGVSEPTTMFQPLVNVMYLVGVEFNTVFAPSICNFNLFIISQEEHNDCLNSVKLAFAFDFRYRAWVSMSLLSAWPWKSTFRYRMVLISTSNSLWVIYV